MSNLRPGLNRNKSEEANRENEYRTFGDKIENIKSKDVIRVCFQNINGFGISRTSNKSEMIRKMMEEKELDIMVMAEVNVNWDRVGVTNSMHKTCRQWFERRNPTTAHNQHDKRGNKHQPGGTEIITKGDISLRINNCEQDKKILGR